MSVCLWSFVFNQWCLVITNFSIHLIPNLAERSGVQTAVERPGEVMDAGVVTLVHHGKRPMFSASCALKLEKEMAVLKAGKP